jgi:hypothetical protein
MHIVTDTAERSAEHVGATAPWPSSGRVRPRREQTQEEPLLSGGHRDGALGSAQRRPVGAGVVALELRVVQAGGTGGRDVVLLRPEASIMGVFE